MGVFLGNSSFRNSSLGNFRLGILNSGNFRLGILEFLRINLEFIEIAPSFFSKPRNDGISAMTRIP